MARSGLRLTGGPRSRAALADAVTVQARERRTPRRSPSAFFAWVTVVFAPFPVLAAVVHVPGLPKNAPVTDFVAAFVPAAVALVLVQRSEGRDGVRALLARVLDGGRVRPTVWWLAAVGLPPASLVVSSALMDVTGLHLQRQPELSLTTMLVFVPVFLLAAAGEELGWSGYVIGPLQDRWGELGGNLLLGLVWWALHVPSIIESGQGPTLVVLGFFGTLAMRVLWGRLFNGAGSSVGIMIILHAVTNVSTAYDPAVPTAANAPVLVVSALVVLLLRHSPRSHRRRETTTRAAIKAPSPAHEDR